MFGLQILYFCARMKKKNSCEDTMNVIKDDTAEFKKQIFHTNTQ